jgi:murein L,D-transpeptidase YcbB/YkuD
MRYRFPSQFGASSTLVRACASAAAAMTAAYLLVFVNLSPVAAAEENSEASLIAGLVDSAASGDLIVRDPSDVREFYQSRQFAPAWSAESDAAAAVSILRDSAGDGLAPATFGVGAILARRKSTSKAGPAEFDVLLTDAVLTYIREMKGLRVNPAHISHFIALPPNIVSAPEILAQSLAEETLQALPEKLAPPHQEYALLKISLARYRKKGESSRVSQIIANMERWRWLPRQFEDSYLEVNSADSTLKAVKGDEVVLASRLVTGKPSTPTPLFKTRITAVTINPSWDVPGDIAQRELLPKEDRHPGYLESHGIVADRPGGALRQLPGAHNALGKILFEMSNSFDVYLHDTPGAKLFDKSDRHLSHGCMRVEQMQALASYVLAGDVESSLGDVRSAIDNGETQTLTLTDPLPVYVLYWTAVPNVNGSVTFHRDVYGWDAALLAALRHHGKNTNVM